MVQYILTPWRDRRELLMVRRQFYGRDPCPETTSQLESAQRAGESPQTRDPKQPRREADQRSEAVARVGMWIQRGNCPHMVESTMALMAAVLVDEKQGPSSEEQYGLRGQYANAFARFVTGLLDGQQNKAQKQSMYSLAKTIDFPATFVELRHESTHEALPSTRKLRKGAREALKYIWTHYWVELGDEPEGEYEAEAERNGGKEDTSQGVVEEEKQERALGDHWGDTTGWTLYEGPWEPKPIGVV